MFGDTGYLIFDPDWQPITWRESDGELWERIGK
jgi:catechol 2,3-dioxygenase